MQVIVYTKLLFLFLTVMVVQTDKGYLLFPEGTGSSGLSLDDVQAALHVHNQARKEVGVPPLEWSDELSEYAQQWAEYLASRNNCEIAHRAWLGKNDKNYGENIFWGTGRNYSAEHASEAWYNEIDKYKYKAVSAGNLKGTGHYTQMVWENTTRVGMGKARCKDGAVIIVANYDPPGNVIGRKPY